MVLKGTGAAEARQHVFISSAARLTFNSKHGGATQPVITHSYKHAGSLTQANASNMQSLCARFGQACFQLKPLAKPVRACPRIPLKDRLNLLPATILASCSHNLHTMCRFTASEFELAASHVMHFYSATVAAKRLADRAYRIPDIKLLTGIRKPVFEALLAAHRLLYLTRMLRTAPVYLVKIHRL